MENYREELGRRIREAREAAGLTQEELAEKIGLKGGAVSKYERGASDPETADLVQIARACRVPLQRLLTGEDSNTSAAYEETPDRGPQPEVREAAYRGDIIHLSDEELQLVTMFRQADRDNRAVVMASARMAVDATAARKESKGNGGGENDLPFAKSG